jgi:hypothetical protein
MISEIKNKYGALAHGNGKDRRHWLWSLSLYQPDLPKGGYVESTSPGWSRASTAGLSNESNGPAEMARDLSKLFRAPPAFHHIRDIAEHSRSPATPAGRPRRPPRAPTAGCACARWGRQDRGAAHRRHGQRRLRHPRAHPAPTHHQPAHGPGLGPPGRLQVPPPSPPRPAPRAPRWHRRQASALLPPPPPPKLTWPTAGEESESSSKRGRKNALGAD